MKEKVIEDSPFERIQRILETSRIPEHKMGDIRWVARNFDVIEPNHPKQKEVHELLRTLLFLDKPKSRKVSKNVGI